MAIDPVCGMTVDEDRAPAKSEYNGRTYYFCAPGCKRAFDANPEKILTEGPKGMPARAAQPVQMVSLGSLKQPRMAALESGRPAAALHETGAVATEPPPSPQSDRDVASMTVPVEGMSCASCVARIEGGLRELPGVVNASVNLATEHARVEYQPARTNPAAIAETIRSLGYTPVLGQSEVATRAEPEAPDRDLGRRFAVALLLTIPVMILGMGDHLGLPMSQAASFWAQLLLATPIQFWAGWRVYRGAFAVARHGASDMNTLIAVGTSAAYFYSVAVTVAPQFFAEHGIPPAVYFDTSATIVTLILLGRLLEA